MSSTSRQQSSSVTQHLIADTASFSLVQTVRLLERSHAFNSGSNLNERNNSIAKYIPPESEVIRFHTNQKLEFSPADINSAYLQPKSHNAKQWHIDVNLMGLTGAAGVLPYHYTELILQRLKLKDKSLRDFFDLFNHRTISLYFQASVKYNLPIEYERKRLNGHNTEKDLYTKALLSIIGLGTKHLNNRLHTDDESLLHYSGLFSQKVKTTSALKQILQRHFSIPVEIKEFVGQWQDLIDDVRTRLTSKAQPKGQNARLKCSAILGKKGWYAQGKIHIILGPLNLHQLERFAPGTSTLKALNEVVRLYAGLECDYDFVIKVKRSDIPNKMILNKKASPIIGWNAWLPKRTTQYNLDETVDITVSAARLQ